MFYHKHAVLFTRRLQATDPRDKVYGVLGISDTDSLADYSKTTKEVYCEFVDRWITQDRKLNVLSYAGVRLLPQNENPFNLPSWTPDWQSISRQDMTFFELYDASALSAVGGLDDDVNLKYHLASQEGVLRVQGVFFDMVDWTEQPPDVAGLSLFCSNLLGSRDGTVNAYPTGIPPLQAIFRVLLADKADPERNRTSIDPGTDSFLGFTVAFINMLVPSTGVQAVWEKLAAENLHGLLGIETEHRFAESFQKQFFGHGLLCPPSWHGLSVTEVIALEEPAKKTFYSGQLQTTIYSNLKRRIFLTGKGYLGLGPPGMQTTDTVSMIFGCKYPVVLRRRDSHFLLVGVCFILGLMDGEALRGAEAGSVTIEEFEIH